MKKKSEFGEIIDRLLVLILARVENESKKT